LQIADFRKSILNPKTDVEKGLLKMCRFCFIHVLCLMVISALLPASAGAVLVFSSEAAYNAAVGPTLFSIDFNGNPTGGAFVDGSIFSSRITFGSPAASDPSLVLWNSDAITDAGSLVALNGVGPISGAFTDGVQAFGLYFSSAGYPEIVALYNSAGGLIDIVEAPNASGFFGVLSDTPIDGFWVFPGMSPEQLSDRFFIDDFRANGSVVPEPATFLLFGVGLAGLAALKRKRARI
jgi:hypothetical protein